MYLKYSVDGFTFEKDYKGLDDVHKLKNVAYLLITISILYYSENKRFFVFIPNILLVILDVLEGSRTIALIAIAPMFISLAIYKSKTFIMPIVLVISLLSVVGVLRSQNVVQNVPIYLDAMGEFRETYVLLPSIITNEKFVSKGSLVNLMALISLPFLHPFREELLRTFNFSGALSVEVIDRGYGLGNNLLVEAIYYHYFMIIVILSFTLIFIYALYKVSIHLPLVYNLIIMSYSILFIRLIIREGFIFNFSLMIFILLVYMLPFLLINSFLTRLKWKKV
jgi:hypothetical protein